MNAQTEPFPPSYIFLMKARFRGATSRFIGTAAILAVCVSWMLTTRVARAGCPNLCDVTADPAIVEPPLPECASLSVSAGSCGCHFWIHVANNSCASVIEARDFMFEKCWNNIDIIPDCTAVEPGMTGNVERNLYDIGPAEWTGTVNAEGTDHRVTVRVNVTSFDDSGGCSCALARRTARRDGAVLGTAVVIGALLRRRGQRARVSALNRVTEYRSNLQGLPRRRRTSRRCCRHSRRTPHHRRSSAIRQKCSRQRSRRSFGNCLTCMVQGPDTRNRTIFP